MLNPFPRLFETPTLTRKRIVSAFVVAAATDALQLLLGPFGFAFADEVLDVIAMFVMWRLLGFHALLLPTFLLEVLPIVDMLPTWTGAWELSLPCASVNNTQNHQLDCRRGPSSTSERECRPPIYSSQSM